MKIYESSIERMRAIYQCPAASDVARVLELHVADFGPILDQRWPAKLAVSCRIVEQVSGLRHDPEAQYGFQTCDTSPNEPLPFASGSFDMVILHYTLDDLATGLPRSKARMLAQDWLSRIAPIIRPGGLVVGCGTNGCSPISFLRRSFSNQRQPAAKRRRAVISVLSCAEILCRAGFSDVQVFNLLTDANNPRTLASTDPLLSHRAFDHELQSMRDSLGLGSYLIRKLLLHFFADRLLEPTLFYWGFRQC